jgi:hypothetical protein
MMKIIYRITYYIGIVFSFFMGVAFLGSIGTAFSEDGPLSNILIFAVMLAVSIGATKGAKEKIKGRSAKKADAPLDYDPDTGEVWEEGKEQGRTFMDAWEDGLETLWRGNEEIAFSYESNDGRKSRRTVTLRRLLRSRNNAIYFRGFCHLRDEERTFADAGITSKITHKGKRYDWEDFVEQRLGVRLDVAS